MTTAPAPSNQSEAARKARARQQERDIAVPRPADPDRRARALEDLSLFLESYAGHVFWQRTTEDRAAMQAAILHAARHGGDQAIAGPRGDGKTTLALWTSLFLMLRGELQFPLIIHKSGPQAKRELHKLKEELEINDALAADFPEVCVPIRALEGWASRAKMQTVGQKRTRIEWTVDHIILPTIDTQTLRESCEWDEGDGESVAVGQILACVGIEGGVRGTNFRNVRPDLAILDDVDGRESANSELQTEFRTHVIDEDILGLAGPGQRIARVMLCTLINATCSAAIYTDRTQRPSWRGRRFRLLAQKPEREDLWDEYVRLRQSRDPDDDPHAREAHHFLLERYEQMHRGAEVSNPDRYVRDIADDGEPAEVSALQHCYNIIADVGHESFNVEYQNEPPEHEAPQDSGITSAIVQSRLHGYPQGVVPDEAHGLTAAVDVGKYAAHWVVIAWAEGATGYVIDYGVQEIYSPTQRDISAQAEREGTERAILHGLHMLHDQIHNAGYQKRSGDQVPIHIGLVDAGSWDTTVYQFIQDIGARPFKPSKGFGSSTRNSPFKGGGKPSNDRHIGEHWQASRQSNGLWLIDLDADYWKRWVHDRFMTPANSAGSLSMYGGDPENRRAEETIAASRSHHSFAKHITAEIEVEEFKPGKGLIRNWNRVRSQNHWLDATYMACAAASMVGVSLMPRPQPKRNVAREPEYETGGRSSGWVSSHKGRW